MVDPESIVACSEGSNKDAHNTCQPVYTMAMKQGGTSRLGADPVDVGPATGARCQPVRYSAITGMDLRGVRGRCGRFSNASGRALLHVVRNYGEPALQYAT